jgi:hypothetical protein
VILRALLLLLVLPVHVRVLLMCQALLACRLPWDRCMCDKAGQHIGCCTLTCGARPYK